MCIILANKQNPLPALPALPCFSELGIMQRKLSQHWSSDPLPPLFINSNWLSVKDSVLLFVIVVCEKWILILIAQLPHVVTHHHRKVLRQCT
jgi:hypothetical protein